MEIVLCIDNVDDAAATFKLNFPDASFFNVDIRRLPTRAIDGLIEEAEESPILFNACAPCQPYSKQRSSPIERGDKRNGLLGQLLRFVKRHHPELIFVENVPGIHEGSHLNWEFSRFRQAIERLKYSVDCNVILSQDYGVPQKRKRLILIASRIGPIEFPGKTHGPATASPEYASVRQWIGDFPSVAAGQEHPEVQNHRAALLSPLNLRRIRSTPEGGGWKDWPEELRPDCHRGGFSGYTEVYERMK